MPVLYTLPFPHGRATNRHIDGMCGVAKKQRGLTVDGGCTLGQDTGGVFAHPGHSTGTAPIMTLFIPGTTPENHPPTEACMIHSKQHWGAEIRTLGPVASIRLNKKIPGVPAGAVGCRIQEPGIRGYRWWKTADFSHSAGTAHGAPPWIHTELPFFSYPPSPCPSPPQGRRSPTTPWGTVIK